MYTNTVIMGNLFGNVQIPHKCDTRQVHDLILLLFRSLLLFLRILPVAGTVAEPSVAAGDSVAAEHTE